MTHRRFEKEHRLASHRTGRDSGVVHTGRYDETGSPEALQHCDGRAQ